MRAREEKDMNIERVDNFKCYKCKKKYEVGKVINEQFNLVLVESEYQLICFDCYKEVEENE